MSLTTEQRLVVEKYTEISEKTFDVKNTIFSYTWAYGSIALLAWELFFDGPTFAGNVGAFSLGILMFLSIATSAFLFFMLVYHEGNKGYLETDEQENARKKYLFNFIKNGKRFSALFARSSLTFWGPTVLMVIAGGMWAPGGMWTLSIMGTLAALSIWTALGSIFKVAYDTLDEEVAADSKIDDTDAVEGELIVR